MTHLNTIVSFAIEASAEFWYINGIFSVQKGNQRFDVQEKESEVYLVTIRHVKTQERREAVGTLPMVIDLLQHLMWM